MVGNFTIFYVKLINQKC